MSNSFNISVKPEIAALETKVDTIDTIVDLIRGTDVPALDSKLSVIDTVVDQIRDIDVPNIQTNIDANETKIDTIDGIVDAIKLKTDATPQNVRGELLYAQLSTANAAFQTVCDVSGHGVIRSILVKCDASDTLEIQLTNDGTVLSVWSGNGSKVITCHPYRPDVDILELVGLADPGPHLLFLEFDTSFKLEIRRSIGTTDDVHCKVNYTLDGF
ncbi:hypothetical protein ES705_34333 [subsurface metagenome]